MAAVFSHKSSDERAALSVMLLLSHEEQERPESAAAAEILLKLHNDTPLANDRKRKLGVTPMNETEEPRNKTDIEDVSTDPIVSKLQQMVEEGVPDAESTLEKYRKGKLSDRAPQQPLNSMELRDGGATMTTDPSNTSSRTLSNASNETISDESTMPSEKTGSNKKTISEKKAGSTKKPANNKETRTIRKVRSGGRRISKDETVPHTSLARQVSPLRLTKVRVGCQYSPFSNYLDRRIRRPDGKGLALSQPPTSALISASWRNDNAVTPAASTTDANAVTMPEQSSLGTEPQLHRRNRELLEMLL